MVFTKINETVVELRQDEIQEAVAYFINNTVLKGVDKKNVEIGVSTDGNDEIIELVATVRIKK